MDKIKNYLTSSVAIRLITVIILFGGFSNQQIGYYKFLRWVVVATSIYACYIAYQNEKKINFWLWLFGLIALLFNPIIPFYLGKSSWQSVDLIVGIIFIISIFFVREKD